MDQLHEIIFLNEFLGNVRGFYAHILWSIHWGLEINFFCVKAEKLRIAAIQDTVNHELDKVEGTCGHAYISWISDVATSNGDTCTIGIFILRSDLTNHHGVEISFLLSPRISSI